MSPKRFPADVEELFRGLDARGTEADLRAELRARLDRGARGVARVGEPATVAAAVRRLLPSPAVPAEALAAFVDESFDRQMGRGDEPDGVLPRDELLPAGFRALDAAAERAHGATFAALDAGQQDELLAQAERGDLPGPDDLPQGGRFDAAAWFRRLRDLVLLAYGSDPRGMVEMGFPGPSYATGHVWLDRWEVLARAKRTPGYLEL